MNMRMVLCIMERTVSFQIFNLDSMGLCNLIHVAAHKIFPCFGVVKMQPFSVLTAQTHHFRPDNTARQTHEKTVMKD